MILFMAPFFSLTFQEFSLRSVPIMSKYNKKFLRDWEFLLLINNYFMVSFKEDC